MSADNFYIALLHSTVYDKKGRVTVTSIVNTDIHDIARCSRTFGIKRFYIVSPIDEQRLLAEKILGHWQSGFGSTYNPSRKEAFSIVDLRASLDEVLADIQRRTGREVRIIVTSARLNGTCLTAADLMCRVRSGENAYLLVFGTGWGLAEEILMKAHFRLEPIEGPGEYNHLPVRAAVAILLDRLWGR